MACKVHKVRYYNPKPHSINCVSYNKSNKQVAVAREDASIEIWDLSYAPYLLKFIPGVESGSVEALGWVNERLLSTGLGGALIEWDLDKLTLKKTVLLTGYAAWCLDVNTANTLVAVGTEQGYVNLYSVENNDIVYQRLFDKQEGRIMCCKFDKAGNVLVTGSIDTIRVWNVATGQAMSRMSARRRGKETIVWCLSVLSDNTVVSGESHGRLTFWDITTGDQIESYTPHKMDILSVAVSEDEERLYCSGLDPILVGFIKVKSSKQTSHGQWAKNVQRHIHEHDVRGLALIEGTLLSVGVDGYMTFSSYPPKWVMRVPPMLPPARTAISAKRKLLLLKYHNSLDVWKLGSYATNEEGNVVKSKFSLKPATPSKPSKNLEHDSAVATINKANVGKVKGQSLKLTENTLKLVSVQAKGKKQITCSCLSPDGEFILYATDSSIRMLKLESDDEANTTSLSKVLVSGLSAPTCDRAAFTHDSEYAVLHCAGTIYILHVDAEAGATVVQTIATAKYLKATTLLHLHLSQPTPSGAVYLVAGDTAGSIAVWKKSNKEYEAHATLPKYHCVPSALTVHHEAETIVAVYVDQKIVEYDLVAKKFNEWPNSELPPEWFSRKSAVRAVHVHPQRKLALIFTDETSMWVLERNVEKDDEEEEEPKSKRKIENGGCRNASLRVVPIKYLSDFHWVGDDEAVVVEQLPENIVALLPPVVQMKRQPYLM